MRQLGHCPHCSDVTRHAFTCYCRAACSLSGSPSCPEPSDYLSKRHQHILGDVSLPTVANGNAMAEACLHDFDQCAMGSLLLHCGLCSWYFFLYLVPCLAQEWEALMIRFCSILLIRNVVEQPVNSRFFRHPDMAVSGLH